jgi:RNA 2',3'-cyclic 3'-phosphodiesterase
MPRLFFALQPTPEQNVALITQVAPLFAKSGSPSPPQPVRAANLHATLCFIGAIEPERLDALRAVASVVRGRRVTLCFDKLEHWETPKILCATASEASDSADQLSAALGEAAIAAGFTPDIKPFRAHLTLARKVSGDLSAAFPQSLVPPTILRCDRFVLMESRREESGSIYSAVDSWPLYD